MPMELTNENFNEQIASDVPIIVDFWASWCGPCEMFAPTYEEVSKEYDDKTLRFAKLSVEEYGEIAAEQGVSGIPALLVFKGGKEVDRIVGAAPKDEFKAKIEAILAKI